MLKEQSVPTTIPDVVHEVANPTKAHITSKLKIDLDKIRAPKIEWKQANNFPLSKIKEMFVIPDFERKVSGSHVNKILISILNNEFYDNIIRVIKLDNGKYLVIDGQHRLSALWRAHNTFGLQRYDLLLGIYENEDEARLIYQRINSGQRLKIIEMMKAMDDGTIGYFNKLRSYCSHEDVIDKLTFYDILNGIESGHGGPRKGSVRMTALLDSIKTVTETDITTIKKLLEHMYELYPKTNSTVYNSVIFRTICAIHFKHKLERHEVLKVTNMILNNEKYITPHIRKVEMDEIYNSIDRYVQRIRSRS